MPPMAWDTVAGPAGAAVLNGCRHPSACLVWPDSDPTTAYCAWCADVEQGRAVIDRLVEELAEIRRQERERAAGIVLQEARKWEPIRTCESQAIVAVCHDCANKIERDNHDEVWDDG